METQVKQYKLGGETMYTGTISESGQSANAGSEMAEKETGYQQ